MVAESLAADTRVQTAESLEAVLGADIQAQTPFQRRVEVVFLMVLVDPPFHSRSQAASMGVL